MSKRRLVLASAAFILAATLFPEGSGPEPVSACVLCGERGVADALVNLALFIPLGIALRRSGASVRRAILLSAALSTFIEVAQLVIPGRNSSIGDLLFNTLGAALGVWLLARWQSRSPQVRRSEMILPAVATASALTLLALMASLLAPVFTHKLYYGQYTPTFENMERYQGHVLNVRVARTQIFNHVISNDSLRDQLLRGDALVLRFRAGPPPVRTAPIFNIYDQAAREVISIAAQRRDLIIRYRTRSATLLLDQPAFRLTNALAGVQPGSVVRVQVHRVQGGICAQINRRSYCPVGFTPGSTAGVLIHVGSSSALTDAVSVAWLALLFFPVGLCLTEPLSALMAGTASLLGFALLPRALGLLNPPPGEFLALVIGLAAGAAVRHWYLQRRK